MNDLESIIKVFETLNYAKFKKLKGNRPVKPAHKRHLKESISKYGDLGPPCLVNEKGELIDGQTRVEIFEELGLPVDYIIKKGYGLKEIHAINSSRKNWTMTNFMNCYVELDYPDYIKYKEFYEKYGFPQTTTLLIILGSEGGTSQDVFKRGEFAFKNPLRAEDRAEKVLMIKDLYPGYGRKHFVAAMIRLFDHKDYSHADFISKLRYQRDKLFDAISVNSYLRLIEGIYNYRRQEKANFYWDLRTNGK